MLIFTIFIRILCILLFAYYATIAWLVIAANIPFTKQLLIPFYGWYVLFKNNL